MKYIPKRKCIACRKVQPKNEMFRITRLPDGTYQADIEHIADGRGAYLCKKPDCIKIAIQKKALHQSFKNKVPEECYQTLEKLAEEQF